MNPHNSSSDHSYNDPTPSPLINPSFNHNSDNNNTTTTIPGPLVDSTTTYNNVVSSEITSNVASTYVDNHMNHHYHVPSGSSTPYPLNPSLFPNPNANTNATTSTATLVDNATTKNNNVDGLETTSNVACTSYDVNNHNHYMRNLQWHSEFPIGYRFHPRDDELIIHYLQKRILNLALPHNKIKNVALYDTTPDRLSEEYEPMAENEWYFFTPRDRKYRNGERPNRAAGTSLGFWKATGAEKKILHPHNQNEVIGYRRSLVFIKGIARNKDKSNKTNWIMNEYRVESTCKKERLDKDDMQLDWVLCNIHKNKSSKGNMSLVIANEVNTQPESEEAKAKTAAEYRELHEKFPPIPNVIYGAGDDDMLFKEDTNSLYNFSDINTKQLHCIVNNNPHQLPEPASHLPDWCDIMQPPTLIYDNNPYYINYLQGSFNPERKPMMIPPGYHQGDSSSAQGFYNQETKQVMNPSGYYQLDSSGAQGLYNCETEQVMNPSGYQRESSGPPGFYNPEENQVMNPYFQGQTSGEQSLNQQTPMLNLENNDELQYNNFIASPNNPSSDVPPSQQMDWID